MTDTPLIFLGAGASAPFDVPTMKEMVVLFEKELTEHGEDKQIDIWKDVKSKLERAYGVRNVDIEHMLTFFSSPFIKPSRLPPNVIYHGNYSRNLVNLVDPQTAGSIVDLIKMFIYECCDNPKRNDIFPIYSKLWRIISGANVRPPKQVNVHEFYRRRDLEVFTTNYDRCFEIFYDGARTKFRSGHDIILDDGIVRRYHSPDNYQNYPRLYKLHGSIQRYLTKTGQVREYDGLRKKGDPVDGDEVVKEWMIWPQTDKYIYQYPYSKLMDKFRKALYERRIWLFVGFFLQR